MQEIPESFTRHSALRLADRYLSAMALMRQGSVQVYLLAAVLMGLALWVRLAIAPVSAGLQYVTLFPAVTLAAIAGGYRAGLLATAIGLVFASFIFTPPYYTFSVEAVRTSLWSNLVFLMDGVIVSYSIQAMHRYRQGYALELRQSQQVNAALRHSEAMLAQFKYSLDQTLDGVYFFLPGSLRFIYANKGALRQVGYGEAELMQMTPLDINPQFTNPHFQEMLEPLLDGRQTANVFESMLRHKDGHDIPVEIALQFVRGESHVSHFIAFSRDITERKQAQSILLERENRYRTLVENSPICIHEIDRGGRLTSMNRAGLQMMGSEDECSIRGLLYLDAVSAADRERIGELLDRAYSGEISHFEFKSAGQRERIFKSCFVPLTDGEGKVERLMGITEDITEYRAAEEQVRSLAFYDTLTQLPNRRLLLDRLRHALATSARSGRYGGLLFIDLDNFKLLNDTLGHDKGDLLLQQVAQRLAGCVREGDTVARLGGDEFVVMLEDVSNDRDESMLQIGTVGAKLLAALHQPFMLSGCEHRSTLSIGATLFKGQDRRIEELLRQADLAMYRSKNAGRNTLRFFDPEIDLMPNDSVTGVGEHS